MTTKPLTRRPFMVAISGGAGSLSAIEALAAVMRANNIALPRYQFKNMEEDELVNKIRWASSISSWSGISSLAAALDLPVIPDLRHLEADLQIIKNSRLKERVYVDLLLDVIKSGWLLVAIHNYCARQTDATQSRRIVDQQKLFERLQFAEVKKYFLDELRKAKTQNTPYTEIVTTQMICMDAICAAVLDYNKEVPNDYKIYIHQYMCDVFTTRAQHYVKSLNRLSQERRSVLHLYGINIEQNASKLLHTKSKGDFASITEIDYLDNPIIRPGFKRADLAQYTIGATETQYVPVQDEQGVASISIAIGPGENIASIMLSSIGTESTLYYASLLSQLNTGKKPDYDKIFIFCGKNDILKKQLLEEKNRIVARQQLLNISGRCELIILGTQDASQVANIIKRSNLIISRGGLVVMEMMALGTHDHPEKKYFFPHYKNTNETLTTGLPWEDGNIDYFIEHLKEKCEINWAKKGDIDDLRFALKPEWSIRDTLREYQRPLSGVSNEFSTAVSGLIIQLLEDLDTRYKKNPSEKAMSHTKAYKLALETMKFIDNVNYLVQCSDEQGNTRNETLREFIRAYDNACYPIANSSKFTQNVVKVIVAALASIVGFSAGFCIGLWTGPGALVSAFSCAALASSFATASVLATNSFFKPSSAEQKRSNLVEVGLNPANIFVP